MTPSSGLSLITPSKENQSPAILIIVAFRHLSNTYVEHLHIPASEKGDFGPFSVFLSPHWFPLNAVVQWSTAEMCESLEEDVS